MPNVLILPRHDRQSASCRHRFIQYLPHLAAAGLDCSISPFFDAPYTDAVLLDGRKEWWRWAQCAARRVATLARGSQYDLVVVHAEIIPYLPPPFERWLSRLCVPYLLDFDDAFFHQYDEHALSVVRSMMGSKISDLMQGAAMNVAGSAYLADYATRFSANVEVVPTVVDLSRYPDAPQPPASGAFRIGWIGSPATTPHLQTVVGELREFCNRHDAEVVAIGAKPFESAGIPIRFVPWTESGEVAELAQVDVGIMPLPDTGFARGKCGFKLLQTMACWRPVVASPVGANCHIVQDGITGLLARPSGWCDALERLYCDADLRYRAGMAARQYVERHYSLDVWGPKVAALWSSVAGRS